MCIYNQLKIYKLDSLIVPDIHVLFIRDRIT